MSLAPHVPLIRTMAFFGDLKDMPFPDILPLLKRRQGTLEVWDLGDYRLYYLVLSEGKLLHLVQGYESLQTVAAQHALKLLMEAKQGKFEFKSYTPNVTTLPLDWPLERLLLASAKIIQDNPKEDLRLPDPATRFVKTNKDLWLDEPLESFWRKTHPYFTKGTSAEELASILHLPVTRVQQYFYYLRRVGQVQPLRAFAAQHTDQNKRNLTTRLLNSLFGRKVAA